MPKVAALISSLIIDRPMCLSCITTKAAVSEPSAELALELIKSVLVLRSETGRCRTCGATDVQVVSVRPAELASDPRMPRTEPQSKMRANPTMPRWTSNGARLIADAITDAALCVGCIIRRTGVPRARVERILATLAETVMITRDVVVCDGCLLTREVVRLV